MTKERLLVDTDMGNDDIMAISILLASSRFEIAGYSLTDGVAKTPAGARNLAALLEYLEKPAPIAIGPQRKFQTNIDFPDIDIQRAERLTLLEGLNLRPKSPTLSNFEDFLRSSLSELLTLVAFGPLTNVAALVENYPQLKQKITKILMMGGGISGGNVTPAYLAEYNIVLDPPAANTVFDSGIPIVMVGIDATKSVPATLDFKERIKSLNPTFRTGELIQKIVVNNNSDFNQFYDPLAASILIEPEIIAQSKLGFVSVIQQGRAIGQTIFQEDPKGNTDVIFSTNSQKFYDLVTTLIEGPILKGGDKYERKK